MAWQTSAQKGTKAHGTPKKACAQHVRQEFYNSSFHLLVHSLSHLLLHSSNPKLDTSLNPLPQSMFFVLQELGPAYYTHSFSYLRNGAPLPTFNVPHGRLSGYPQFVGQNCKSSWTEFQTLGDGWADELNPKVSP